MKVNGDNDLDMVILSCSEKFGEIGYPSDSESRAIKKRIRRCLGIEDG